MKILYLCSDPGIPVLGRKGASVHVRELIAALSRAGHSVALGASVLNKSPWEEPARVEAQPLLLSPSRDSTSAVLAVKAFNERLGVTNSIPSELRSILYHQALIAQLKRQFDRAPPDLIYERASLYGIVGASLARELNLPLFVEVNAPLALEHSTYYQGTGLGELAAQAERWVLLQADVVLTISGPLLDHVVSQGVEASRVAVLPNGVDTRRFHPGPPDHKVRARWGLGRGPILGFVGGLRPWTGVDALPMLTDRLAQRYGDLQLVIAGDGPLRTDLEREVADRRITDRVIFTGALPHEEIGDLIRVFDVGLAPYSQPEHLWYASPMKVFEYMACGVPVVAAGLGQIREVVQDDRTGLLYQHGDLDALMAACDRLLGDPSLGQHLGEAAAKEVHGRYTWDHNAARVLDLAQAFVAGREESP